MPAVQEAAKLLRVIAEPYPPGDSTKVAIWRAVKKISIELVSLGAGPMDYERGRNIWYRRARRIEAFEFDAIRRAAIAHEAVDRAGANQQIYGEINAEYLKAAELLTDMLASVETCARLDADPERYRPQIDRLSEQIECLRRHAAGGATKKRQG